MERWICVICGFIYDEAVGMPEHGIAAGTRFSELPEDWMCPECGSPKSAFEVYSD
ncbi:MAG TPA: rubredoxin [Solimonas sp.]